MRALIVVAASAAAACGVGHNPLAGSGPTGFVLIADGGTAPTSPVNPSAHGGAGSTSGIAPTADAGRPLEARVEASVPGAQTGIPGAGQTGTAGTGNVQTPGAAGGFGVTPSGVGTTFQCGALLCAANQFCLVQTNIQPSLTPPARCVLIPANCTSCDCLKPFVSCLCSPQLTGGIVVTCP